MTHPAVPFFRQLAPEFAALTDSEVEDALAIPAMWLSVTNMGRRYLEALALLAAHSIAFSARPLNGQHGTTPLTGERAGRVAFQYSQGTGVKGVVSDYSLTPYGMLYLALLRTRPRLRMMTTSNLHIP